MTVRVRARVRFRVRVRVRVRVRARMGVRVEEPLRMTPSLPSYWCYAVGVMVMLPSYSA